VASSMEDSIGCSLAAAAAAAAMVLIFDSLIFDLVVNFLAGRNRQ
jgi:uncharacterized membrane protein YtjA (UPF0391 family)